MKKRAIFLIICIFMIIGLSVFSDDHQLSLFIDQVELDLDAPVIERNGKILVPMTDTFEYLGAQVYEGDIITSYYLNTFVKIDSENNYYAINGKKFTFDAADAVIGQVQYVPLALLQRAFDLTVEERMNDTLYLKANTVIQYRNFDAIQYKQISFEEDGVRFSVPLDWEQIDHYMYGYDSSYGRISVEFSSRKLNDNIDIDIIKETYEEHLLMEYGNLAQIKDDRQKIFKHLTSNVLYIQLDVNDIISKRVVHFIESDDSVYIVEFNYPNAISETYLSNVIQNMMDSFYIDAISIDDYSEHYLESHATRDYNIVVSSDVYSNMTIRNNFMFEGYFNTNETIDSISITVSRDDNELEFYVPVQNNSFSTRIFTPFGLGKHNVKIALSGREQKVSFDPITGEPIQHQNEKDLLWFSVVNVSDLNIRYTIPTKMVQSTDVYISSMSDLITYKYHTYYSKAKAIYDFIQDEVELLPLNEVNYSALDVYENFKGTKKEIAFYTTALLRAQNIQAKIVEGSGDFSKHLWVEAYLNGSWLIIDPSGDQTYIEIITSGEMDNLEPSFNGRKALYRERYPNQNELEY